MQKTNLNHFTAFFSAHMPAIVTLMAMLLLGGTMTHAQNVTIKASNGSMIASRPSTGTTDTFFSLGGFATWKHEQLALTMTTSDQQTLTDNGQLANPANNIYADTSTDELQIGKGKATGANVSYVAICLPKGYRFTGYTIVFSRNKRDFGTGNENYTSGTSQFGETNSQFAFMTGYYANCTYGNPATRHTISRTAQAADGSDMGNILYFKLAEPTNSRAVITLHNVELFFTAEADYTPMTPAGPMTASMSAVRMPFPTSKVDYGRIASESYQSYLPRISYSSANVRDLQGDLLLYEAESVEPGTDFDGTTGNIVRFASGTISSDFGYFKLGRQGGAQTYYIETPTSAVLSNGDDNPVGYRIVQARFDCIYGTQHSAGKVKVGGQEYNVFHISFTDVSTTYYMTENGGYTTSLNGCALWFIDNTGYIRLASDPTRYLKSATVNNLADRLTTVSATESPSRFQLWNNQIFVYSSNNRRIRWNSLGYFHIASSGQQYAAATNYQVNAFTPADFKLHVFDKTGTEVASSLDINSGNTQGTIILDGLNNDAVKFSMEGVGLVKGTLTLQALDPYIDNMSVVCQDQAKPVIRITQTFTASDFSVSGGEFHFYLPEDCITDPVAITFEDLHSKYADETYEGGAAHHTSRFNYVKSEHYNAFGLSHNNINIDPGNEAQNAMLERQKVGIVGDKPFRFNNADEFTGSTPNAAGYVTEYPFSLENYAGSPNNGTFDVLTFTVQAYDQSQKAYVFTTDETRYNIAPTTATQHRTYAFYKMDVHVQSATYTPKVKIQKVYDKTFYDNNGTDAQDAFYGAIVTSPDNNGMPGFASDQEVANAIQRAIDDGEDDYGNTDVPHATSQILYVDLIGLAGFYENATLAMNRYKNQALAKNALIFLPKGSTYTTDNFAYQTESGILRSANNIVLTDKQPFFSPYEIQVDAANYATYSRLITRPDYGQAINATVILPFTLAVVDGIHTNADGRCAFSVNKMVNGTNMQTVEGSAVDYGTAFFSKITGTTTEANTPYMIKVERMENPDQDAPTLSFVATQYGSNIIPTPATGHALPMATGLFHEGETATAQFQGASYTFTNQASFSGAAFDRALSEDVFYFANNKYLDLHTLAKSAGQYLFGYPFRGVYTYTKTGQGAKSLKWFDISYDSPSIIDTPTSILRPSNNSLDIKAGHGQMVITAHEAQDVNIHSVAGNSVSRLSLKAGASRVVSLPAGIYMVNGEKVIIK